SAAVGMAANPFGAHQAGRSAAALDRGGKQADGARPPRLQPNGRLLSVVVDNSTSAGLPFGNADRRPVESSNQPPVCPAAGFALVKVADSYMASIHAGGTGSRLFAIC
ncbi:MAG: hypothetical protein OXH94_01240, partial [Rhodospirillales bacterium]|nr:hypothetical protein [Rhodospirillales bacterium]